MLTLLTKDLIFWNVHNSYWISLSGKYKYKYGVYYTTAVAYTCTYVIYSLTVQ